MSWVLGGSKNVQCTDDAVVGVTFYIFSSKLKINIFYGVKKSRAYVSIVIVEYYYF